MIIDRRQFLEAVRTMLAEASGRPVFRSKKRFSADQAFPYAIVYLVDGGDYSGPPYAAPEEDAEVVIQVTSVGKRDDQAEWMASRARAAMIDRDATGRFVRDFPAIDDYGVMGRAPLGGPGAVSTDGPFQIVAERFTIWLTPITAGV